MPIKPDDYHHQYKSIPVSLGTGSAGIVTLSIDTYRSGKQAAAGKEPMRQAMSKYFHDKKKANPGWAWTPGLEDFPFVMPSWFWFSFPDFEHMKTGLVSCYSGKGNPGWLAFILHCAVKFKLVAPTQKALQDYCDANLGIDCNGFVGNYILHGYYGVAPFQNAGKHGALAKGPSALISYLCSPPHIKAISEMDWDGTYILAQVDKEDGHILKGNGETGHIMVTVPNSVKPTPAMVGTHKTNPDSYTCTVVESRGRAGLTISDYTFLSVKKQVFTVYRGCSNSTLQVKICKLV